MIFELSKGQLQTAIVIILLCFWFAAIKWGYWKTRARRAEEQRKDVINWKGNQNEL